MRSKKPHVAVFFGGTSGNHDLSEETGYWVCQYMPRSRYRVTPVRVTTNGQWQVPLGSLPEQGPVDTMMSNLFQTVRTVTPARGVERLLRNPVDVMMSVVRGKGGDDGSLHGLGQTLNVPVVGSPLSACQLTSDKHRCAQCLSDIISFPQSRRFRVTEPAEAIVDDVREEFVPPLFVKPVHEEGSVGVIEVSSADELGGAVREAQRSGDILIQSRVPGTEVTVTLFEDGRGKVHVLPLTVVTPKQATFYDHLAKRRAGRVVLTTAAGDAEPWLDEAADIARDVYEDLGLRGVVSLDLIMGAEAAELLDVNTVPVLTALTPLMGQLKAAGVHPHVLLDGLIRRSLEG